MGRGNAFQTDNSLFTDEEEKEVRKLRPPPLDE